MNRRFLFPLAAGVVGLVAISPVLAAEQSTPAANVPAKATTTTMAPEDDSGAASDSDTDPAQDQGTDPGSDSSSTTATTGRGSGTTSSTGRGSATTATTGRSGSGSGSGSGRSSSVCDEPVINKEPAPQVGDAPQTHEAGEAGSVDVERLSETELRIVGASANDGWTEQVATPSGPRVTVKFTRQGESPTLIRFAASMDQRGTMIHTRVTSCG
jgi:hypothetical protein